MNIPPGPKGHWLYGSLASFRENRLEFFRQLREEFGDVVRVRAAHRVIYFLFHPDAIAETLVANNAHLRKHFALRLNPLVLGQGLLTSEGDFWLRQRRLIQPVFLKSRLPEYGFTMLDAARKLTAEWRSGERIEMHAAMSRLTLDIAARTLFSAEVGGEAGDVVEAMNVLQSHFMTRFNSLIPVPVWVPTPRNLRFRKAIRRLDEILFRFIRQRRASGERKNDLLSLLLDARDVDDGGRMSDRQLRDEAMTLFLAGHETTALAMSWTWHLLASHPDVEAKLVQEWRDVLGDRLIEPSDWTKLRYTECVILEAMRLYPPAYVVGREALRAIQVAGFDVPRGTTLMMPQWVVHRDERFWPKAATFRPDRWLEPAMESMPKFAYFPFGGGPRMCIGNFFATMEMVLCLTEIGRRWHASAIPGFAVQAQPTFTLRPVPGLPMTIHSRDSAPVGH